MSLGKLFTFVYLKYDICGAALTVLVTKGYRASPDQRNSGGLSVIWSILFCNGRPGAVLKGGQSTAEKAAVAIFVASGATRLPAVQSVRCH